MNNQELIQKIIAASKGSNYSYKDDFIACIEKALMYIEQCEQRANRAEKQLLEYSKDSEITNLQEENKQLRADLYRGFPISKKENEAICQWQKQHKCCGGAIGGSYTYEFTPTAIGTIGIIKCSDGSSFTFRELGT